jgi:hypothetical protein
MSADVVKVRRLSPIWYSSSACVFPIDLGWRAMGRKPRSQFSPVNTGGAKQTAFMSPATSFEKKGMMSSLSGSVASMMNCDANTRWTASTVRPSLAYMSHMGWRAM